MRHASSPRSLSPSRLLASSAAFAAASALTFAGLGLGTPAQAVAHSDSLVINEVYGGGGNSGAVFTHDFVELKNVGSEPISLDGYSLQYAAKGGSAFNNRMALNGTVQPGQTFLIQLAAGSGNGQALPAADLTGSINASGTGGTFALVNSTDQLVCEVAACQDAPTVIDLVGWGGALTFSGSAPAAATSNATSASRTGNTGENAADFAAGAPTPSASGGLPDQPGGGDPSAPTTPEPTTPAPTTHAAKTIAEIQGTGAASPLNGQGVTTEGVVTAVYSTGGLDGFVIQQAGTGASESEAERGGASTALFVYSPQAAGTVAKGDSVRVSGTVGEYYGQTQLTLSGQVEKIDALTAPTARPLAALPDADADREKLEHMLLDLSAAPFTVTDVYNTAKYGEVTLVAGDEPLYQAGEVMAPGPEATAMYEANQAKKLILDDGKSMDLSRNTDQPTSYITQEEPVRLGAKADLAQPVVLGYGHNAWRLQPTSPWESASTDGVTFENTREASPREVGGDFQLATFNVLNYFPTLGEELDGCTSYNDRDGNPISVRGGCIVRGAFTKVSFERQEAKIVEAISGTGAEVVGLMEIENSAQVTGVPDEATATLVAALNERDGAGTWDYIRTAGPYAAAGKTGGQDAITSAIIYKKSELKPVGDAQILIDDPAFSNAREPIGQVFVPLKKGADGSQVEGEPFFFVVNHFKSKGSTDSSDSGLEPDPVQGNARTSRQLQADALVKWSEERSAALGVKDVYFGGDFNAYTKETALQSIYDRGYTDVLSAKTTGEWSYAFGGMVGSLDHVIASDSAMQRVTGATDWSINGPESVLLQYSRYNASASDLYRPDVFASSDHNPLIIGLDAGFPEPAPAPAPGGGAKKHPVFGDNPGKGHGKGRGEGHGKSKGHGLGRLVVAAREAFSA